ncbi:MAG: hypothetical protein VST70_08530, partial [Nitrospirota bacterium]|nr:hypothetical protein [Nitrospirota bacterium]
VGLDRKELGIPRPHSDPVENPLPVSFASVHFCHIHSALSDRSGSIIDLSIIPHTILVTTLGDRIAGDTVHLELDMVGKYVDRFRVVDGAGGGAVGV